jgi:molecular chaperone GrpE
MRNIDGRVEMSVDNMKAADGDRKPEDVETKRTEDESRGKDSSGAAASDERRTEAKGAESSDELSSLKLKLDRMTKEVEEYKNAAARAKADFYNYRTRVERDRARDRVLAAEGTVDTLLPVLDNLERTLRAVQDKESPLYKGVAMVQKQFFSALQDLGLQVIDTSGHFDPAKHEAMMMVDSKNDGEDGLILEELNKGYILGEKVLRAAQVKIARKV